MNLTHLKNPEDVERLLEIRRQKMNASKLPPPDRTGMQGELKHPTIPGVVTGWFHISVSKATAWLDYNIHNRKLSKHKIAAFARQHYHGEFVTTHQGIAFGIDEQGNEQLIDGQHTLKMILCSELPLTRMVTFGLPKKVKNFHTMDVIDAGGRSVPDPSHRAGILPMKETKIEWCDSTVNPTDFQCCGCELWNGKTRDCYAGRFAERREGKGAFDLPVVLKPGRMAEAARWSDLRGTDRPDKPWLNGRPRVIFIGDMADTLQPADDAELIAHGEGFAACRLRTKHPKGGDMAEWPEQLRVRQFPEVL